MKGYRYLATVLVAVALPGVGVRGSPGGQTMFDFAIVHARTTFTMPDGRPGASRYTDVWARRDGRWLAVSAHVTRR